MKTESRFYPVFLFLTVLFVSTACSSNPPVSGESKKESIGLLWEVKKPEIDACYLFGTIHSEDERVTQLPGPVKSAFDKANTLAVEMMLDKETSSEVLKLLYFSDGRRLKSLLDEALYLRAVEAMKKRQLPENIVNQMKPWAVFMILNMPEQKTGLFLDMILFNTAKEQNKKVYALETPKEQTDVFDSMAISTQISLLKSTLDNILDMNKLQNEVIDVYLRRDLNEILALNEKYESFIDAKIAKEFNQRLVIDRNHRMLKRMNDMLQKGNCFVAVGALHLPGDDGLLNLVKQKGFEVRALY